MSEQCICRSLLSFLIAKWLHARSRESESTNPTYNHSGLRESCCCTSVPICSSCCINPALQYGKTAERHPCSTPGVQTGVGLSRGTREGFHICICEETDPRGPNETEAPVLPEQLLFLLLICCSLMESVLYLQPH